jgi:pimeloyl-ACP methyl ester carboxylesterase
MEMFAKAVEAVRAEQKADKIVLVGHSMGTPVIREYARRYPQHDGTRPGGRRRAAPPRQGAPPPAPILDPAKIMSPEGLQLRETMIKTMFTPKTPKDVQDRVLKMMLAAPPATAAGAMVATFDPSGTNSDVMAVPAYGIFAEKSFALSATTFMKTVLPKLEYVEMPGTGHFVMMEQPQEFNRLLIKFVESL